MSWGQHPRNLRNGAADCQSDTQSPRQHHELQSALPAHHFLLGLFLLSAYKPSSCNHTLKIASTTSGHTINHSWHLCKYRGTTLALLSVHAGHAGKKPSLTSSRASREKCKSQKAWYFTAECFKYVLFTIYSHSPEDGNSSGAPQAVAPTATSLFGICQVVTSQPPLSPAGV